MSRHLYVRVAQLPHLDKVKKKAGEGNREDVWALVCASCRGDGTEERIRVFTEAPATSDWLSLGDYIVYLYSDLASTVS